MVSNRAIPCPRLAYVGVVVRTDVVIDWCRVTVHLIPLLFCDFKFHALTHSITEWVTDEKKNVQRKSSCKQRKYTPLFLRCPIPTRSHTLHISSSVIGFWLPEIRDSRVMIHGNRQTRHEMRKKRTRKRQRRGATEAPVEKEGCQQDLLRSQASKREDKA